MNQSLNEELDLNESKLHVFQKHVSNFEDIIFIKKNLLLITMIYNIKNLIIKNSNARNKCNFCQLETTSSKR